MLFSWLNSDDSLGNMPRPAICVFWLKSPAAGMLLGLYRFDVGLCSFDLIKCNSYRQDNVKEVVIVHMYVHNIFYVILRMTIDHPNKTVNASETYRYGYTVIFVRHRSGRLNYICQGRMNLLQEDEAGNFRRNSRRNLSASHFYKRLALLRPMEFGRPTPMAEEDHDVPVPVCFRTFLNTAYQCGDAYRIDMRWPTAYTCGNVYRISCIPPRYAV